MLVLLLNACLLKILENRTQFLLKCKLCGRVPNVKGYEQSRDPMHIQPSTHKLLSGLITTCCPLQITLSIPTARACPGVSHYVPQKQTFSWGIQGPELQNILR